MTMQIPEPDYDSLDWGGLRGVLATMQHRAKTAEAELARIREGSVPIDVDPTIVTPAHLWTRLLAADPDERARRVAALLEQAHQGWLCWITDHAGRLQPECSFWWSVDDTTSVRCVLPGAYSHDLHWHPAVGAHRG